MKSLNNIIAFFLLFTVIITSLNFNLSKIICNENQAFYIGNDLECNQVFNDKCCPVKIQDNCCSKKNNEEIANCISCNSCSKESKRIHFDFTALIVLFQKVDLVKSIDLFHDIFLEQYYYFKTNIFIHLNRFKFLTYFQKPIDFEIQVFLI